SPTSHTPCSSSPYPPPPHPSPLSLHDALPISGTAFFGCATYPACSWTSSYRPLSEPCPSCGGTRVELDGRRQHCLKHQGPPPRRSEEHTSELQSRFDLVCRLLLEKKKKIIVQS